MIHVIEVRPDGRALIDTEGLYRIRLDPSGEIIDELCTLAEAKYVIEFWEELEPGVTAVALPYKAVAQRS